MPRPIVESFVFDMSEDERERMTRIEGWLKEEGFLYTRIAEKDTVFTLRVDVDGTLLISEWLTRRGKITVTGYLQLESDRLTTIESLEEDNRQKLLWEIRFAVLQRENQFRIKDNWREPNWIGIQRVIYEDELSKSRLMRDLTQIPLSFVKVLWIIDKYLGSPMPKGKAPNFYH